MQCWSHFSLTFRWSHLACKLCFLKSQRVMMCNVKRSHTYNCCGQDQRLQLWLMASYRQIDRHTKLSDNTAHSCVTDSAVVLTAKFQCIWINVALHGSLLHLAPTLWLCVRYAWLCFMSKIEMALFCYISIEFQSRGDLVKFTGR